VKQVVRDGERVTGVIADSGREECKVSAKITVGTYGRYSAIRKLANFDVEYEYYKNDIVWFTIPLPSGQTNTLRFCLAETIHLVLPKYPNHMQIGLVFQKNKWKEIRERGIESFRETLRNLFYQHPFI
jgi:2-polyprenyl-6-methoxyphenol hydroxylase-like FAD-dependent oxidoreductase